MTTTNQFRFAYAFAGFFILGGLVALGFGVWNLAWSFRCAHWPTTQGVIQTAKMERHESRNKTGTTFTYSADISYNYQVAGTNYTSTRLAFGEMSSSTDYAQRILDRFPVGRKVPVHYSPDDPRLAVLETGVHGGTWICFGVGTVFSLAGWMMLKMFSWAFRAEQTTQTAQMPETKLGLPR